jgi:hypothetical protein
MDIPGEINVYADAKTEYTRQLTQFTQPSLIEYFLKMFESTKESEKESKKLLLTFQNSLKQIPEWNYEKVQKETTNIIKNINCDYYDDLLSAVFVAHTKVLSAIRLTSKQKKLQITIPKIDHFIHHTLIECARILWSSVFLFSPSGTAIERQKNFRNIEQLIQDGILQSIRSMLPVKNILKEYLRDDDASDNYEEKDEEEDEKKEGDKEGEEEKQKEEKDNKKEDSPVLTLPTISTTKQSTIKSLNPPVISVDTEPSVKFAEVNTIIDIESNNNDSDSDDDDKEIINILDDSGEVLNEFETLDQENIDYESL